MADVHDPALQAGTGRNDPEGVYEVVNVTPMNVNRMGQQILVGEVVMKAEMAASLKAAQA